MFVGVTRSTLSKPYLFDNEHLQPEISLPSNFDNQAWESISSKRSVYCLCGCKLCFQSSPEHLYKVWRISNEEAKRTIEWKLQRVTLTPDSTLLTNNQMLHYKWIKRYFFTDTFFATSKGGKSSRGNTCCSGLSLTKALSIASAVANFASRVPQSIYRRCGGSPMKKQSAP